MREYIIAEDFNMDKYIFDESNGLWYLYLPQMSDAEFTQAAQDAVLLWEREEG